MYKIDFTRFKIRDMESGTVLFEITKPPASGECRPAPHGCKGPLALSSLGLQALAGPGTNRAAQSPVHVVKNKSQGPETQLQQVKPGEIKSLGGNSAA